MSGYAEFSGWLSVTLFAVLAIAFDIRARRVPNWLAAAGLALAVALVSLGPVWALAYDWRDMGLGGGVAFACFLPLYALGWMGAGDVKFFTVTGLLVGWHGLVAVWLVASVLSGLHGLAILLLRRLDVSTPYAWLLMRSVPALARWDTTQAGRRGIPYAACMAVGLLSLPWIPPAMRVPWLTGM